MLGADLDQLCVFFKVKSLDEITEAMAKTAIDAKKKKLEKEAQAQGVENA